MSATGSGAPSVTLEIALAPPDARHAQHVLPHRLRTWAGQVNEILVSSICCPSPVGPIARGSPMATVSSNS